MSAAPACLNRLPLALVHHANQYLITDGYTDREGLRDVIGLGTARNGLLPLLQLHLRYRIPLNLHVSGTLIESVAWHCRGAFAALRPLRSANLLEIVGSAFSQPVMPLFSDEFNLRQLKHDLWLQRHYLDCDLRRVKTFWVPERVWDTRKLARVIASDGLPNGGYARVLLDDRLIFPTGERYEGSAREQFDHSPAPVLEAFTPCEIAGGAGLLLLPISRELRYLIPPVDSTALDRLEVLLRHVADGGDGRVVAVYADDLEKAAGVGSWDPHNFDRYSRFLGWLRDRPWIQPILLGEWAVPHGALRCRDIDPGTFYELAREWGAGEDYRGWSDRDECHAERSYFAAAERALLHLDDQRADAGLAKLAWQHLMHCSYEALWHDPPRSETNTPPRLAPWSTALASHARSCHAIAAAATWAAHRDGNAHAEIVDIDHDNEQEVVLKNDQLFAVVSPRRGARMTLMFDLTGRSARLVVGNISDDWNWQIELHRFMDCPRNHPGAFSDVGFEHDEYEVVPPVRNANTLLVVCRNIQRDSALYGAVKELRLTAASRHVSVTYRLPPHVARFSTEVCLSPNYYRLLRHGRTGVVPFNDRDWRGWANGATRTWVRFDPDQLLVWDTPHRAECGHGLNVRVTSFVHEFDLEMGVGIPRPERMRGVARRQWTREADALCPSAAALPATDPHVMRRVFDRHLHAMELRWSRARDCRVRVLKRHHDQLIVEYRVAFDLVQSRSSFDRVFIGVWRRDDSGRTVYRTVRALWDHAFAHDEWLTIAEPLAYWNRLQLVLYARARGKPLKQLIYLSNTNWPAVLARVAAWLAKLHRAPHLAVRAWGVNDNVAELLTWREDLIKSQDWWLLGERERIGALMDVLIDRARRMPQGATCVTHGDFHPENILVHGSSIAVIDFEHMAIAPPASDLGFFVGELEIQSDRYWTRRGRPNPLDLRRLGDAFLEAYCAWMPTAQLREVPFYRAQAYFKHLMYTVRMRGTEHPANITRWLDRAEAVLNDDGREPAETVDVPGSNRDISELIEMEGLDGFRSSPP
jgi:hypothetical protein